jgi:AcrR family transcriptional regulator
VSGKLIPVRRRLPRAQREQRILDVAAREFDRFGFREASLERIASGSGITKALVYQYFDSKEGLYSACVERGRARLFETLRQVAEAAEPRGMLGAIVDAYFDQVDAERGSWYLLYGDAPRRAVDEMRRRNAAVIAELLRAGASLDDADVELAAQLIVGAGEQVSRWWLEHREVPAAHVKAKFTAAIAGAIGGIAAGHLV